MSRPSDDTAAGGRAARRWTLRSAPRTTADRVAAGALILVQLSLNLLTIQIAGWGGQFFLPSAWATAFSSGWVMAMATVLLVPVVLRLGGRRWGGLSLATCLLHLNFITWSACPWAGCFQAFWEFPLGEWPTEFECW